ncbi:4-hydroxy-3-methylbut-2-enyl diphosphate reductase [Iodidimonas sp. SYSU 1G8]|uniref:4-hydroxy-3-methylbut-2-enyl diphosphate reductase n=1 Tax=Iodidimonas sp. SYSU 1G8 TaxID=3133967 RepID=UPI0031FF36BE
MKILLAQPRGFCAGVERAIDIVERALVKYGRPVYVRHEIVHNKRVVEDLRAKGAVFVDELDEVPAGSITIFSAHGVAKVVEKDAGERGLEVIDATCPLVAKVHMEGQRYARNGHEIILIGHEGHAEVIGTLGQIDGPTHLVGSVEDVARLTVADPEQLAYVTQTTLSVDDTRDIIAALNQRFPAIKGPDVRDICYATQNRQEAVRHLVERSDVLLVIGAQNSSNSNRLREIGAEMNIPSYLIDDATCLDPAWLDGKKLVGVTAGASAPEALVDELIARLKELGAEGVEMLDGLIENVQFKLPSQVRNVERPAA